jgi:hypothetical protein
MRGTAAEVAPFALWPVFKYAGRCRRCGQKERLGYLTVQTAAGLVTYTQLGGYCEECCLALGVATEVRASGRRGS